MILYEEFTTKIICNKREVADLYAFIQSDNVFQLDLPQSGLFIIVLNICFLEVLADVFYYSFSVIEMCAVSIDTTVSLSMSIDGHSGEFQIILIRVRSGKVKFTIHF